METKIKRTSTLHFARHATRHEHRQSASGNQRRAAVHVAAASTKHTVKTKYPAFVINGKSIGRTTRGGVDVEQAWGRDDDWLIDTSTPFDRRVGAGVPSSCMWRASRGDLLRKPSQQTHEVSLSLNASYDRATRRRELSLTCAATPQLSATFFRGHDSTQPRRRHCITGGKNRRIGTDGERSAAMRLTRTVQKNAMDRAADKGWVGLCGCDDDQGGELGKRRCERQRTGC